MASEEQNRLPAISSSGAELATKEEFTAALRKSKDFEWLVGKAEEALDNRHAPSTRTRYDYWLRRFETWLLNPDQRGRLKELPPISLSQFWPIDSLSETMLIAWLTDEIEPGPDDDEEEWAYFSPSTLSGIVSAIKAKARRVQEHPWEESNPFSTWKEGKLKQLHRLSEKEIRATPLLAEHVYRISKYLAAADSPEAARDRLVLEMFNAGCSLSEIGRISPSDLTEPRPGLTVDTALNNSILHAATGEVGLKTLIVPGRRYRGGRQADPKLLCLAEHPELAEAIEGFNTPPGSATLAGLTSANPSAHARKRLIRLAELAGIEWTPTDGALSPLQLASMRACLDRGFDWTGQLTAMRDQVMVLVGFSCAMRRHELCDLKVNDVRFVDSDRALITIRRSKTDQKGEGHNSPITRSGHTSAMDPITLLRRWIEVIKGEFGATGEDPLFPRLTRAARRAGSVRELRHMDPQSFSDRLRKLAIEANVFGDDLAAYQGVRGHSLRRGMITQAILEDYDVVKIATHSRHKDILTLKRYADQVVLEQRTDWTSAIYGPVLAGALAEAS